MFPLQVFLSEKTYYCTAVQYEIYCTALDQSESSIYSNHTIMSFRGRLHEVSCRPTWDFFHIGLRTKASYRLHDTGDMKLMSGQISCRSKRQTWDFMSGAKFSCKQTRHEIFNAMQCNDFKTSEKTIEFMTFCTNTMQCLRKFHVGRYEMKATWNIM